ncbi:MAG TPA: HDOD domain-containing protein [Desulfobacterales bacterium]
MNSAMQVENIVGRLGKLPTLPGVAMKILEAVRNDHAGLKDLAAILSNDPSLSAEVLRLINSSYYGYKTQVTNVQHAVKLLGATAVKNLALSFSLVKTFLNQDGESFNYTQFWKDSLLSAVMSKKLGVVLRRPMAEDLFFLGLLNNIGILILNQLMPDQYRLVLAEKSKSGIGDADAELRVLGFTHMEVGSYITKKWGLPDLFFNAIAHHHNPENLGCDADADTQMATRVLHLTAMLVDFIGLPNKAYSLGCIQESLREYGYDEKIDIELLLSESQQLAEAVYPIFEIRIESEQSYISMLETAREELIRLSSDFISQMHEQRRVIEDLNLQANHDGMTGLVNYQCFQKLLDEELYRAVRYRGQMSLVMLDLDYFKKINDTYGHLAGDAVLRAVGDFLRRSVRKSDVVARYGGEEFALLLPETPQEGAFQLVERLREQLATMPIYFDSQALSVTMSAGIAGFPGEVAVSGLDMIARADSALYRAKKQGRNCTCLHV